MLSSESDSNYFTTKDFTAVKQYRPPTAGVTLELFNNYTGLKKEEKEKEPNQKQQAQDASVDVSINFRNMSFELDRTIKYLNLFVQQLENHTAMVRNNKHYRQAFLALLDEYRSKIEALEIANDKDSSAITSEKINLEHSLSSSSLTLFINTLERFQELTDQIHKRTKRYANKKQKAK